MSRKYLNDRWCVRCGRTTPTPYLRKNTKHLPEKGRVLDIGCGNGRNSVYLKELGYEVDSVDMAGDFGIKSVLGKDPLPAGPYDIILANYVLMFLNTKERYKVMGEMLNRANAEGLLFIEMYPAKDAYAYNLGRIVRYFTRRGCAVFRQSKDRCILVKG